MDVGRATVVELLQFRFIADELTQSIVRTNFYRPQLDVVRFCAFFAVFNHHVLPRTGVSPLLATFANACGFGLSLFFVLSAYLIALILLREQEHTGEVHLRDFYVRRILRIWPLYLLGLAIGVLRAYSHGVLDQQKAWFIAALLLAGNLVPSGGLLMSHLWSISVEEQFYLLLPSPANLGRKGLLAVAVLLIVAANVTLCHFALIHAELDSTIWFSSLVQFQMFAFGVLLALVDRYVQNLRFAHALAAVGLSVAMAYFVEHQFHLKTQGASATSVPSLFSGYALLGLACCLFIIGMQHLPAWSPFTYLGKISYGLYVFHIPAIVLIGDHLKYAGLNVLGSLLLTVLLASTSYHVLERPFLQLKRRFEIIPTRTA